MINQDTFQRWAQTASLSPSPHNVQPIKYWHENNNIYVWADTQIRVPVCDPTDHDFYLSLGAHIEGLEMALHQDGYEVQSCESIHKNIYKLQIKKSNFRKTDLLFPFIEQRYSYRGKFAKATSDQHTQFENTFKSNLHSRLIFDRETIMQIASLYTEASRQLMDKPGFLEELNEWLRFSKNHPRYNYDGLNPEQLNLNAIDSLGASVVLKPKAFRILNAFFGLGHALANDIGPFKTCMGLLVIVIEKNLPAYERGSIFYRQWLHLTQAGVSACPMSNVSDYEPTQMKLRKLLNTQPHQHILNVFRFGIKPDNTKNFRARRPLDEIIKKPTSL